MKNLEQIIDEIEAQFDELDNARELCLKSSRTITRLASGALRKLHRGEDISANLQEAKEEVSRLRSVASEHEEIVHSGYVEEALQEFTEVVIVDCILTGKPLPGPRDIGVPSAAFILGLGDVIGELRREAMESLRRGDLQTAVKFLKDMEEMYDQLMRFDHPSAIVPIRRKQDVARTLIEKTRGEIAVATRGKELEDKISLLEHRFKT